MNHRERTRQRLTLPTSRSRYAQMSIYSERPLTVIQIEELILKGMSTADGRRIGEAFQTELERLVIEEGLPLGTPPSGSTLLHGGTMWLDRNSQALKTGKSIAHSVHRAFGNVEANGSKTSDNIRK